MLSGSVNAQKKLFVWLTVASALLTLHDDAGEVAQAKKLRLAFSAYANPPFWIAHE